jgi:hypothetical protein
MIQKYTFAANNNSTDVGNLTVTRGNVSGTSSLTFGYTQGGWTGSYHNVIDKHSFSSDGNASDVGNLIQAKFNTAGQSY